jgi:hypothetical protein
MNNQKPGIIKVGRAPGSNKLYHKVLGAAAKAQ